MQRLALAILMVGALIALLAYIAAAFRRPADGPGVEDRTTPMQRVAYFVLIALMLYVSVMGSGA